MLVVQTNIDGIMLLFIDNIWNEWNSTFIFAQGWFRNHIGYCNSFLISVFLLSDDDDTLCFYGFSNGAQTSLYNENPKKHWEDSRCFLQETWKLSVTQTQLSDSAAHWTKQPEWVSKQAYSVLPALMSCFIIFANQPVICHYVFPCIRHSGSNI